MFDDAQGRPVVLAKQQVVALLGKWHCGRA